MADLREQIISIIRWEYCEDYRGDSNADEIADRILAIPEIREALELKAIRDSKVGYERQG